MNANFYLKDSTKDTTMIRLHLTFNNKVFKYPTGINIQPKQWSKVKQKIHSGVPNSKSMNTFLKQLKDSAWNEYYDTVARKETPTFEYLKEFLDENFKKGKKEIEYLTDFLNECINSKGRQLEEGTIKGYRSLKTHLLEFEKYKRKKLTFDSLNKELYTNLIEYFAYEKNMENSTIKEKHIKNMRSFLNWSVEKGFITKNPFKEIKFPYKIPPTQSIALTEEELNRIYHFDLSGNDKLQWVRDILCFECYSGLRFGDLDNVTPDKLNGNRLNAVIKKTNDLISVPLRPEAIEIINKYFENNKEFPNKSNQKTNKYLKELGKLAKINDTVTSIHLSGNKRREATRPKYEMLGTHTGRRTFVTLSYQKGMRVLDIMAITGHKDYDSFRKYYRLDNIKVHENFHNAWSDIKPKYDTRQIIKNLLSENMEVRVIASCFGIDIEEIEKLV